MTAQAVVLKRRPNGAPVEDDFEVIDIAMPHPGVGEVVTRTLFLSIDPYMRGRLSEVKSYAKPVAIGEVITGETVGEVVASAHPGFSPGDIVLGGRGWQTHILARGENLVKLPSLPGGPPVSTYLGVLGMPGTTAYSGMTDIGQPKAGETVVITAASGAVGSVAGQLAKRAGARVVGVAGGPEKCLWVQESLGFDACVDHRAYDLPGELAAACPQGIDVYFENVGGLVQQAAFPMMNPFGRIVMCGMVAQYNSADLPLGPNLGFMVRMRVRMQGLIVSDRPERFAEWRALATPWVQDGSLVYREDVVDGLAQAPGALIGMLNGRNFGKLLVRMG
jgi:NADPH-dependent curcumin reductase CurA